MKKMEIINIDKKKQCVYRYREQHPEYAAIQNQKYRNKPENKLRAKIYSKYYRDKLKCECSIYVNKNKNILDDLLIKDSSLFRLYKETRNLSISEQNKILKPKIKEILYSYLKTQNSIFSYYYDKTSNMTQQQIKCITSIYIKNLYNY